MCIYPCSALAAVWLYRHGGLTALGNRVVQNAVYASDAALMLFLMHREGKPLRVYGLWKERPLRQLWIGAAIAGAMLLFALIVGWRPSAPESLIYLVCSQLLVAAAEELTFRGFLLTSTEELLGKPERAVLLSAALFGLWHYPMGQSWGQVVGTFLIGAIFGALRTGVREEIGLPALAIAHCIWNVAL
ncbi:MAG: CPBP family intramembrane metalloprotease [Oscillospiraceae bacterium]|nr:CPBP family intramembrane metalloprotease [Oscillospiraceae bacterium]MBR1845813.1 CPBP family intramembrane metalloprotease [Oscillospiraceae bacterium]